jgi:2-polyprenyl-3-methyl-5-hydroxy-6-metoxy-1,4-benzoquinol methylase
VAADSPADEATHGAGACSVCGFGDLRVPSAGAGLRGTTSDCKPWPESGTLAVCAGCGLIQKVRSAAWEQAVAQVYDEYTIYHQSPGAEQTVFDQASGVGTPRSVRLLQRLFAECDLPASGRLLDIGCGNGVLLRNVSSLAPTWALAGADLDDRHRATVESIPGVERFYAGPAESIQDRFDVITLQHVLEHVPEPAGLLSHLGRLLSPGGLIFVQVPNIAENPFDLMVVDHTSHFSPETARTTVRRSGQRTAILATNWAPKELTVVVQATGQATDVETERAVPLSAAQAAAAEEHLSTSLRWLAATAADAAMAAEKQPFGLLGTSTAATWLGNMLGGAVQFFVDEDRHRIGRQFQERPVVEPSSVPAGAEVYVVFPPAQARDIRGRLAARFPQVRWLVPPERPDARVDSP